MRANRSSTFDCALPLAMSLLAASILSALIVWFVPHRGLWSGDQGIKIVQILSLARSNPISLALPYPGQEIDPDYLLSPLPRLWAWSYNGQSYGIYPAAYTLIGAVSYRVLGFPGLSLPSLVFGVATMATGACLARQLRVRSFGLVPALLAICTPLGFYSLILWEHTPAAFLVMLSIVCIGLTLDSSKAGGHRWAMIAGMSSGAACWFRMETAWFTLGVTIALLTFANRRWAIERAFALGVAVTTLPLAAINLSTYGNILGPQVALSVRAVTAGNWLGSRIPSASSMILDLSADNRVWWMAVIVIGLTTSLVPRLRSWSFATIAGVSVYMTLRSPVDALHTGIFATSPLIALALMWPHRNHSDHLFAKIIALASIVLCIGVFATSPNDGGAQWGPRYLLPVIPPLTILGLATVESQISGTRGIQRSVVVVAVAAILAVSSVISIRGVMFLERSSKNSQALISLVSSQPYRAIVSDVWYGPQLLGPLYFDHLLFFAGSPERLAVLGTRLREARSDGVTYVTAQSWGRKPDTYRLAGLNCTPAGNPLGEVLVLACTLLPER